MLCHIISYCIMLYGGLARRLPRPRGEVARGEPLSGDCEGRQTRDGDALVIDNNYNDKTNSDNNICIIIVTMIAEDKPYKENI